MEDKFKKVSETEESKHNDTKRKEKRLALISILLPVIVLLLFGVNLRRLGFDVAPLNFLPPIYAAINAFTAVLLCVAFVAVMKKKLKLHELCMKLAIFCSCVFLLMYVAYHMTAESTKFGGEGAIRCVYFTVLISHILLSAIIVPMVLITFSRALSKRFDAHKKLARYTFPIWLYVAVSGVVVYLMISPYYQQ